MRALKSDSLGLFLFHQLKSRLGASPSDPADWDDTRFASVIAAALKEIPGLQVAASSDAGLTLRFDGETESHTLALRPIIDSLRLVWREYRTASGDH